VAKASTKQINTAIAASNKAAVAEGQALAALAATSETESADQQQQQTAQSQCDSTHNTAKCNQALDYQGKAFTDETGVDIAKGMVDDASQAMANAIAPLTGSSSSVLDDILVWGGIALGAVAVVAGGAALYAGVVGGVEAAGTAATLGAVATVTGGAAMLADTDQCLHGNSVACVAAGLGAVATAGSAAAWYGSGQLAAEEISEYSAAAIAGTAAGAFGTSIALTTTVIDSMMAALATGRAGQV
jgi:hypothetical protein